MSEAVALTSKQLQAQLSQQCEASGSKAAWARKHRIPLSQVCEAISGTRGVPESIILALGWVPVTRYVPVRRGA
jgi:hypothetical protein